MPSMLMRPAPSGVSETARRGACASSRARICMTLSCAARAVSSRSRVTVMALRAARLSCSSVRQTVDLGEALTQGRDHAPRLGPGLRGFRQALRRLGRGEGPLRSVPIIDPGLNGLCPPLCNRSAPASSACTCAARSSSSVGQPGLGLCETVLVALWHQRGGRRRSRAGW